ncbi:Lrp/AsnC family transcriptional regulator [Vaginisenegalia massiliensis]|uniref:Lrp/AsnC family transcriptional regulator n=1 Tax=Vaginisenegalia massiliensis TaxID=2058294 RepID=UPI001F156E9B|nr:Lrp/AsnC family transcriptional regulator [Vaginisenegalia massiliensis]
MEHKEKILRLLETNSKLEAREIAIMLGLKEAEVQASIENFEQQRIICGYHTLVNWDKTDDQDVSAIIELKVNPQRGQGFDRIADKIYQFPEVEAMYLMSGGFDFMVELKKAPMKEIANFVSSRLSIIEEVQATATHIILKKYKDHGTIFEKDQKDHRMVITP